MRFHSDSGESRDGHSCAEPIRIQRYVPKTSPYFRLQGAPGSGLYVPLDIEFAAAKPLLVTGYPLGASKEMLTKHSQFNRIAPIKIIRAVPSQEAVKV